MQDEIAGHACTAENANQQANNSMWGCVPDITNLVFHRNKLTVLHKGWIQQ